MQEQLDRLIEQSGLPVELRKIDISYVTPGVQTICNSVFSSTGIIYLYGNGIGKTTNAAAILMSYLNGDRDSVNIDDIGLFTTAYELCMHNKSRYGMDAWLTERLEEIKRCKCLVLDDVFSYLTQQDDMLLQTIFDMRQYCGGVTVITSSVANPFDCAGSVLHRIARSAKYREEFKCQ